MKHTSLLFLLPVWASLAAGGTLRLGPHQAELERYRGVDPDAGLVSETDPAIPRHGRASVGAGPCATVFGYLPYWVGPDHLRYDLLTHIACFSVEVNSDGTLGDDHGWPWTSVISEAHASGVKIILVATLFGGGAVETLVSNPAHRATFFANIKNKMLEGDADGLNIDFEGFDSSAWISHMPEFLGELNEFLDHELPGSELSIAGPAVNWGNAWDLPAVAAHCDAVFVMGYDFYGSWSSTSGPSAPLTGGSINITDTILNQYAELTQNSPQKLILGVPYYGNRWTTSSSSAYAPVIAWIGSMRFSTAQPQSQIYGVQWDAVSQTPWYAWHDGSDWNQVWFDSAESIALKFDLAQSQGLQGVGMWALGYDGDRPELWDLIEQQFVADCPPSADLNGDAVVDAADLAVLLGTWGPCAGCNADLNGDDVVDASDLAILLASWGIVQ